jgi:hypothetical protein
MVRQGRVMPRKSDDVADASRGSPDLRKLLLLLVLDHVNVDA